jgi:formylglycine-generating enzyme required for sulfatase activity/flavodoxin
MKKFDLLYYFQSKAPKLIISIFISAIILMTFEILVFTKNISITPAALAAPEALSNNPNPNDRGPNSNATDNAGREANSVKTPDNFILVKGGSFQMGSPNSEAWRSADEKLHKATVSDFYIDPYEVTQDDYNSLMGKNPSNFKGAKLPVENVSWLDAIAYCNAKSQKEGLTPAYVIDGQNVVWDRSSNGYRLPTETEWEYACRAGTVTPFNTETSIGQDEANYYGHYPYQIEENYFSQAKLETKPGEYRQTTTDVGEFSPNKFGLYNMHGNVGEWVWDYYGEYGTGDVTDPAGPESGTLRVYRGGGWNDFAKNLRSAYRATLSADKAAYNIGIRLARNASAGSGKVTVLGSNQAALPAKGKLLIAFYSWGGNTRGIAEQIRRQTGADIFEIQLENPYSSNYNTVLEEAQRDQNRQARPKIKKTELNMDAYDTILLGYPNWWASIPMPIATFLEEYDFSGKKIIPFCSHGGGRFGQSLTAIAKLEPDAVMGEALSVHYSGGSGLSGDIAKWIESNEIKTK